MLDKDQTYDTRSLQTRLDVLTSDLDVITSKSKSLDSKRAQLASMEGGQSAFLKDKKPDPRKTGFDLNVNTSKHVLTSKNKQHGCHPRIEILLKSFQESLLKRSIHQIVSLLKPSSVETFSSVDPWGDKALHVEKTPVLCDTQKNHPTPKAPQTHLVQINLPRKKRRWTVLRSPHIDKKSREQFEMQVLKALLWIELDASASPSQVLCDTQKKHTMGAPLADHLKGSDPKHPVLHGKNRFLSSFLRSLQNTHFMGVQVQIRYSYSTYLPSAWKA
jgi:ribosomal protein S10